MAVVFDTPFQIELYKLYLMEQALKWQAAGRPLSMLVGQLPKGRTPLQILRKDYNIHCRTAKQALPVIASLIAKQRKKVADERKSRELA